MIIVPAWVEKDEPDGILAVLGSEPQKNTESQWIPRSCIENCIYSDLTSDQNGKRMAMIVMAKENLPDGIAKILRGEL